MRWLFATALIRKWCIRPFLEIDEYRAIVDGIGGAESYEDI